MNASAVDPLHFKEQRVPPHSLLRHAGDSLLLLVQWVDRDATDGAPIALLLQWVERNELS